LSAALMPQLDALKPPRKKQQHNALRLAKEKIMSIKLRLKVYNLKMPRRLYLRFAVWLRSLAPA
jgi:hypothetical protein